MHAAVMDSLEEYLSGSLEPVELREIEAHLSNCDLCREEVRSMQDMASLFGSLRSEETIEASPAFFAGVMRAAQAERPQPAPSFAGLFSLDLAFGRRLVFASLLTLAMAGSFLVSRESDSNSTAVSPDVVMAQQNSPGFDSDHAPDNMLVTLTAYEH
jgi:anti-sigma factor RsiW